MTETYPDDFTWDPDAKHRVSLTKNGRTTEWNGKAPTPVAGYLEAEKKANRAIYALWGVVSAIVAADIIALVILAVS